MRSFTRHLVLAAVIPALSAGATAHAVDVPEGSVGGELAAGAQFKDVDGSSEKFQEYRDVRRGFILDDLRLTLEGKEGADYLQLEAKNALRDDASYSIEAGRYGKLRVHFEEDLTPHNFSRGTFLWGGFGTGRLRIADVARSQLEANEQTAIERGPPVPPATTPRSATDPNQDTTGEDAIQQGIVRGLYQAAPGVTFRLRRERTGGGFEYSPARDVDVRLGVTRENRTGARVITAGTYERWNVGSSQAPNAPTAHTIDRFIVAGADLAEPIDYRTLNVSVGASVRKRLWTADLEYTFTDFGNENAALRWDDPFRITDAQATANGNFDRGRFAVGQIALPPDSNAHDVTATAAVELPLHGRLTGSLSFGFVSQDEAFQPYTLNTAIVADNVPGTPSAATLALPARDLGGSVRTRSGSLALSLRPLAQVGVNAKYRYYKYDGRSREVTFPGYAAFGESFWRRFKNDKDAPVKNDLFDYTRQNAELAVDVRALPHLTVTVEGGWEGTGFSGLRLKDMDELSVGGAVTYRLARMATLKAGYRYLDRTTAPYLKGRTAANPEATGLVNFNWAARKRHQADARFQITPLKLVSVGLLVRAADETYRGDSQGTTVADAFRFGRTGVRSLVAGGDVTVTPIERFTAYASYSREYRQERMASASKDDGPKGAAGSLGIADDYARENYWSSQVYERVHTVGVGATAQLLPEVLVLDVSYSFSYSNMDVRTQNPNGVSNLTLANAVANPWPTIRNRLHEIVADLGYEIAPGIRAGARYLYEWYKLEDFAWDLDPYMAGRTVENSTRFLFADATYGGYRAHLGRVYIAGRF